MEVRPIDENRLEEEIASMHAAGCGTWSTKGLLDLLCRQPTLTPPNEPLELISMEDELPPDNERVLVYRPCMADADIGPYSVQWGWAAKKDGSYWAPLTLQPNEPLTLDELRGMEGQPVYLETGKVSIKEQIIGCWEIVRKITRFANETVFWMTRREGGFGGSNYGTTWLAYRRPPEGERSNKKWK